MGSTSNTTVSMAGLDFVDIKYSLSNFLSQQAVFKDYNFAGSGLSVLLDVLALNTQYNAYYLNMVANEMFLDTALQRSSVVSQAKLLGYTPQSAVAPTAIIDLVVHGVTDTSLTLDKYTQFVSRAINGVNYTFLTEDATSNNTVSGTVTFSNVMLKQGVHNNYSFVVDTVANPNLMFDIPDANIDVSSLLVTVQQSNTNTYKQVFEISANYLTLDGTSMVYFMQEGSSGNYQIYFGDGVLGKALTTGNIINVDYISTHGESAQGANNFTLMQPLGGYANTSVFPIAEATNGSAHESISSIKFQAPKAFSAQGRAVTKDDYITAIQQNKLGITFDAVSVWGGEENDVPVYGQVFISLKPSGAYNITDTQKNMIISRVINPISVMTVKPTIVDPDYTYIMLTADVLYSPGKTSLTSQQLQLGCVDAIGLCAANTLNTFNSTFSSYGFSMCVIDTDPSIISDDISIKIQKKIYPNLTVGQNYTLNFDTPLSKGILSSGVTSSPSMKFVDPTSYSNIIDGVFIEEVPVMSNGVDSILMINPGMQYTAAPLVKILGDGTGATAHAILSGNGSVDSIVIDSAGIGYTSAIVSFTNQSNDTTGKLAVGVVSLQGALGTLRTYYINSVLVKTVLNANAGTIDYVNGVVQLNNFAPVGVDNVFGDLKITVNPVSTIISSTFNRIITIDPFDPSAITVNIVAKT